MSHLHRQLAAQLAIAAAQDAPDACHGNCAPVLPGIGAAVAAGVAAVKEAAPDLLKAGITALLARETGFTAADVAALLPALAKKKPAAKKKKSAKKKAKKSRG